MQIILVLETRKSCNSDYRYIKATIDYFYKPRSFSIKPICAKNKSELINQNKKIKSVQQKYNGQSIAIICADYDRAGDPLNKKLIKHCSLNNYELVWMNKNVEHVYLNNSKVINKEKASLNFLRNSNSILPTLKNLYANNPLANAPSSNILCVLDKYLPKK